MRAADQTVKDFAKAIGASPRKAAAIIAAGEIAAYRIGGSIRLQSSDIESFIEARRVESMDRPTLKALVHAAVERAKAKNREKQTGSGRK